MPPSGLASLTSVTEDTGSSSTDFITSDTSLIYKIDVTGLEEGDTVWMRIIRYTRITNPDGTVTNGESVACDWVQAVKQADGSYAVDRTADGLGLTHGDYRVETIVRDSAGNHGATNKQALTIDTRASAATVTIDGFEDDAGAIKGDFNTSGIKSDDATPRLHGTLTGAEKGDRVHVTAEDPDGKIIDYGYATIVDDQGHWSLQVTDAQKFTTEGNYKFTATVEDIAGNAGNKGNFVIEYDVTPPKALDETHIQLWDDYGPVQGNIDRGSTTDDTTPTYRDDRPNAVDPNEVKYINVYNYDKTTGITSLHGQTTVNADGSWRYEPKPPLGAGDYSFTARPVDAAGNEGPATKPWDFTVITDKPQAPTLDHIYDNVNDNPTDKTETTVQKGGITNDATPILTGTGTRDAVINIYEVDSAGNKTLLGQTKVDSAGNWRYELEKALTDQGEHTFVATTTDAAGQESVASGGYNIILDTVKPVVTGQINAQDNVNVTGPITDGVSTDDASPVFSGEQPKTEEGSTVNIYDRNSKTPNVPIATTTVGPDGKWSITSPHLSDGEHNIYYEVVDRAQNKSEPSQDLKFNVDTSGVSVSFIYYEDHQLPAGSTDKFESIANNGLTNDPKGTIVGKAKPGSKVVVTYTDQDGHVVTVGTATADTVSGEWRITPTDGLPDGLVNLNITATDQTGQTATAKASLNVDTKAPDAPQFTVTDDVGDVQGTLASGQPTDDKTPTFSGKGEKGSVVTIKDENGNVIGETTITSNDGSWSITTSELQNGSHKVTVTETDTAGNVSKGTDFVVNVDLTPPSGLATLVGITDDNGSSKNDFITNDTTLIYTIAAPDVEPGGTVRMRILTLADDGKTVTTASEWIEAIKQDDGTYKIDRSAAGFALKGGKYIIETVVWDQAGNHGTVKQQEVIIDTTTPVVSGPIAAHDDVGTVTGPIKEGSTTDDDTPTFSGQQPTSDKDATVNIYDRNSKTPDVPIATTTVGPDGKWSVDPSKLGDGEHNIYYEVVSRGGNKSAPSSDFKFIVDTSNADVKFDHYEDHKLPEGFTEPFETVTNNGLTNDPLGTLVGKAKGGSTVVVTYVNDKNEVVTVGSAVADETTGEWRIIPTARLPEGVVNMTVTATDKSGNAVSTPVRLTVDTTPPSAPVVNVSDDYGDVQGPLASGQVTDDTTPTFSGEGEVGSKITIKDAAGKVIGETIVQGEPGKTGKWSITTSELPEGKQTVTITETDKAGNTSEPTKFDVNIDRTAPSGMASLTAITDDTGADPHDFKTNDTTLIYTIETSGVDDNAGDTVWMRIVRITHVTNPDGTVTDGEHVACDWVKAVGKNGVYKVDRTAAGLELPEGEYRVETMVKDAAGNHGTVNTQTVIIDKTASPATVTIDGFEDNVGPYQDFVTVDSTKTDDTTPELKGTLKGAEKGDRVHVTAEGPDGKIIDYGYATIIDDQGHWSLQVPDRTPLGEGKYTFKATVEDQYGNNGNTSSFSLIVDKTPPSATAELAAISDDTGVPGDFITSDTTLIYTVKINGTLDATDTVWIRVTPKGATPDDSQWVKATRNPDGSGTYIVDNDSAANQKVLQPGTYTVETAVRDEAGNSVVTAKDIVIATGGNTSAIVHINGFDDNEGAFQGFVSESGKSTDDRTPKLSGTIEGLEAGDTIVIRVQYADGTVRTLGTATVSSDGKTWVYQVTDTDALRDGNYKFTAVVVNKVGTDGSKSNEFDLTVDTQGPTDASAVLEAISDDTGISATDFITSDDTLIFKIKGDKLSDGDTVWMRITKQGATADDNGWVQATYDEASKQYIVDWDSAGPNHKALEEGTYTVETIVRDAAGNVNTKTPPKTTVVIDKTGPADASATLDAISEDTGASSTDFITSDTSLIFKIKGDKLGDGDTVWMRVTKKGGSADVNGWVQATYDPVAQEYIVDWNAEGVNHKELEEGTYTVETVVRDKAGNFGSIIKSQDVVIDKTGPSANGVTIDSYYDNITPNTGDFGNGTTTNDKAPLLKGKVDADPARLAEISRDEYITIYQNGVAIGTTSVDRLGEWTYQIGNDANNTGLDQDKYTYQAKLTDKAGNTGTASGDFTLNVDTIAPTGSASLAAISEDTGASSTDFITSDTSLIFKFNVDNISAGDTVWMRITKQGDTPDANGWVQATYDEASQQYIVDWDSAGMNHKELAEGSYTVETALRDDAGNFGPISKQNVVIDKTGPIADGVTIDSYYDSITPNMGDFGNGSTTNDKAPLLKGTVKADATRLNDISHNDYITIYQNGVAIGTTTVDGAGNWTYQIGNDKDNTGLDEGKYSYKAVLTDKAGNAGTASSDFNLNVDTTAPAGAATLKQITDDTGVSNSDFLTNDGTLIYTIKAPVVNDDETVWIRIRKEGTDADERAWVQATKNPTSGINDEYILDNSNGSTLADGTYIVETAVRDKAGNFGPISTQNVVIDTHVSDATVTIDSYGDHVGEVQGDALKFGENRVTDDRNPILNGSLNKTLESDEIVVIYNNGVRLGEATLDADGKTWHYTLPDLENQSKNNFVAKVEDKAGNVGASSPSQYLEVELVVNVNTLSTTDHTPIVSGSTGFDIRHGETVEVTINGHTYSSATGEVVVDFRNNTWYVQIPDNMALPTGVYDVSAVLKNKNGDQVTQDATHNELTIDPTPTVNVGAGGSDPNQKATGVTVDQNGQFMIFSNQAIMSQSGHDNGSVGNFTIKHVDSQEGGNGGDGHNNVQTGTWMDYDRDGYMDFFGSDSTFSNGQQAFLNNKGNGWIPYQVGAISGAAQAVTPANPDGLYNPNANTYVWFGGVVAFDKLGTGYTSIAYGDQTPDDPYAQGGLDSFIVLNIDGTMAGMLKDWNYTKGTNNKGGYSPYVSTNSDNANAGMEMSGIDLNNDGTVDLVYHAEGTTPAKIGGPGTSLAKSTNTYKLVVAQNMGDGSWYTPQILNDFFQRNTDNEGNASSGAANGISMTWADFNGDGYMDLFVGRGRKLTDHSEYESRILFNDGHGHLSSTVPDGIGTATNMYFMGDNLAGGASIAVDWNHDGKMDIIETPAMYGKGYSVQLEDQRAPVNLYTNTSKNGVTSFETSTLIDKVGYLVDKNGNPIMVPTSGKNKGQELPATVDTASYDPITGAVSVDVDYDGAKDLLVFTQNGHTKFVRNENVVEYGTSLHFRILDQDGINSLFGNTIQLYNSKGEFVAAQVVNPQSGNQTNDSTAIVDFYGLDKNETYSLLLIRSQNGKASDVGGLPTLGGSPVEHVNSSWTGLKATEANHAYVLTANGDDAISNATRGPGLVGTGYNDTFIAAKGTQYYEGGGGTVVVSGEKSWSNTGGEDIVDYYNSTVAINVDLSITGAQNTGYNTAKFSNIEGIYGTSLNDTFKDGAGDNIFNGRGGDDTFFLTQGKTGGKDTLLYELIDNNDATGGNGHDTVYGFTVGTWEATPGADRIDIRGLLIGYKADADGPAHYIDGTPKIDAGDNIGQYLSTKTEGGNTVLYMDRDGAGGAFNSEAILTLVKTDVTLEELLANHQIVV